jgi:hypothetical protein
LPPRSSRWRWTRPELASSGATPLWRASCVGAEAVDRAELGQQLRRGQRAATGQLEQGRRRRRGPLFQLAIELDNRARERTAAADQIARDSHPDVLLTPYKPTANAIELRRPIEMARGNGEGGIELMQVPTQTLLRTAALVDEIIAVVNQQLQLPKRLLIRPWPAQARLAQRGPGDGERIDRIGLAAGSACAPLRRHQLRWHPHQRLAAFQQLPFEPARQLSTVLKGPQPLTAKPARPGETFAIGGRDRPFVQHPPSLIDGDSRQRVLVHVHSDHDHLPCLLNRWGDRRADRPHSRQLPSSYQVTLGGLGTAAATQRWQVSPRATCGNRVSRRRPSLCHSPDVTTAPTMTVSCGMPPESRALHARGR